MDILVSIYILEWTSKFIYWNGPLSLSLYYIGMDVWVYIILEWTSESEFIYWNGHLSLYIGMDIWVYILERTSEFVNWNGRLSLFIRMDFWVYIILEWTSESEFIYWNGCLCLYYIGMDVWVYLLERMFEFIYWNGRSCLNGYILEWTSSEYIWISS